MTTSEEAKIEIKKLNKLAEQPDGLRLLEECKNNMRFCRTWNGLCGADCISVSEHLDKLIEEKKKPISVSDVPW